MANGSNVKKIKLCRVVAIVKKQNVISHCMAMVKLKFLLQPRIKRLIESSDMAKEIESRLADPI